MNNSLLLLIVDIIFFALNLFMFIVNYLRGEESKVLYLNLIGIIVTLSLGVYNAHSILA